MVEILKSGVVRVQSSLNPWMDCIFLVSNEKRAKEVLQKAWDDFWEDGDCECYGDFLEEALTEANINFESFYAGSTSGDSFGPEE